MSIAVSFFVMILSVSVSSGFREEIRDGISSLTGDIRVSPSNMNIFGEDASVDFSSGVADALSVLPEVILHHYGEIGIILFDISLCL